MNIFRKLWARWFKKQHGFVPVNGFIALSAADLEKHFQLLGKPTRCFTSFLHISREMVQAEEERRGRVQSRWDARCERMRMERRTAPALGTTRRQGRL